MEVTVLLNYRETLKIISKLRSKNMFQKLSAVLRNVE